MIYLASPYSATNHDVEPASFVREQRYQLAKRAVYLFMTTGKNVYSPIVHCHEIAKTYTLRTDANYWSSYNQDFICAAAELFVLTLHNWRYSIGTQEEIAYAKIIGKPIKFYEFTEYYKDLKEIEVMI